MNAVLDTRTHGQLRHAERHIEPAPHRRHNRDLRAVRTINWRAVFGVMGALALTMFLASPTGMAIFAAVWGTP